MLGNFLSWVEKNKYWLVTHLPAFFVLILLWYDENLSKKFIHYTAYSAIFFLGLVLILKPIRIVYPNFDLVKNMAKHKREIGVASFTYAALHIYCYYLKKKNLVLFFKAFLHPFIIPASFIAVPILFLLTITSNNFSVKKLGFIKWKKLHRFVYFAEFAVIIHAVLMKAYIWSLAIFLPLLIMQAKRLKKAKTEKLV